MTDINATVVKPSVIQQTIVPPEPPAKPVEMQLIWYGAFNAFQVASIKNSTHFLPGVWISAGAADQCCKLPNWTVTMADNQVLQQLLGLAASRAVNLIP